MSAINLLLIILIGQLFALNKPAKPIIAPEKKLEIRVTFPDKNKQVKPSPCLNIRVCILNHTDTVTSFFEDWNSWGYFNIRFQVKTSDTTFIIYKKDRAWSKNFPSFKVLFPGDSMALIYSLDYGNCTTSEFSEKIPQLSNNINSIKVIYQQNKEALEDAKLTGFIKYKRIYNSWGSIRHSDSWVIVDSLKNPVEVNRTFPLSRLESKEYELK